MDILILGPGCAYCLKVELFVMQTLIDLGIRDTQVKKNHRAA